MSEWTTERLTEALRGMATDFRRRPVVATDLKDAADALEALRAENAELQRRLDEQDGLDWLLDRWLHLYPASIARAADAAVQEPIREASTAMAKLRIALDEHRGRVTPTEEEHDG